MTESDIFPDDYGSRNLWRKMLAMLAIRRSYGLLRHAGLPIELFQDIEECVRIAEAGLSKMMTAQRFDPDYLHAAKGVLADLRQRFGPETAGSFLAWARRHYAHYYWRSLLGHWSELFPRMLRDMQGGGKQRFDPEIERVLAQHIEKRFNPQLTATLETELQAAFAVPLSPLETEIEGVYFIEDRGWGVLGRAFDAVLLEQAHLVWNDLERALDSDHRRKIVAWGREIAYSQGSWDSVVRLDRQLGIAPRYACACCGYLTLSGSQDECEICDVCWWEAGGAFDPKWGEPESGPNNMQLDEARRNFLTFGAMKRSYFEPIASGSGRVPRPPLETEIPVDHVVKDRADPLLVRERIARLRWGGRAEGYRECPYPDHAGLYDELLVIFDLHNPINVLGMDSPFPDFAYDTQIEEVLPELLVAESPAAVRRLLHVEFSAWFQPPIVGPEERFTNFAADVWDAVQRWHNSNSPG